MSEFHFSSQCREKAIGKVGSLISNDKSIGRKVVPGTPGDESYSHSISIRGSGVEEIKFGCKVIAKKEEIPVKHGFGESNNWPNMPARFGCDILSSIIELVKIAARSSARSSKRPSSKHISYPLKSTIRRGTA